MNRILIICFINVFIVCPSAIFSQMSEGGIPPGFQYQQTLRKAISATNVPVDFYIEDLRETDYWQARDGVPMPVAKLIPVDYTMDNSGYHTILPGGEHVWRLHLKANDAIAIMLYYSDFYIPEGGRLFIYSADQSQVLGAYTHRTHPQGGLFATEFVGGDELILEYAAPETSDEKPRISICEVGYGYNTVALQAFCHISTYAATGACEVNVNCEEGDAWQNEKKGVCYTVQKIGNKSFICSGSLMNNTAEDFKPLILTALHCAYDGSTIATKENMQQWMFYFHKEKEACSDNSRTTVSKTMTGCTLLTATGMERGSDGLLVVLNDTIPDDYDVFYNGWDCSGVAAQSGVCIHHPNGDNKKISTYDETVKSYTFMSTEFTGETNAHWNAIFKSTPNGHGVTEGGSSGSPLFNENKLVIGTLSGGNSSCNIPKGINLFGKFSYHWDRYKRDSTRMDLWLDPIHKGVKTIPGRFRKTFKPAPVELKAVNLGQSVSLTWNAPQGSEQPIYYNVYRNNDKIDKTTARSVFDKNPVFGSIVYSVSAVYENNDESPFISTTLLIIQYKPPSGLKVMHNNNLNQVEMSWNAPVYEQTIYWGTFDPIYRIGFDNKIPFYFGQKWTGDEIQSIHLKTITAVQFMPVQNNTYEIYITQGDHSYRQPVNTQQLNSRVLNTVNLTTPFVIDGSKWLIVSIFVSRHGADYAAWCDDGPVENGKGNICAEDFSGDDIDWVLLNDDEEPGEFDFNFILAAIVSSKNGQLSDTKILSKSSQLLDTKISSKNGQLSDTTKKKESSADNPATSANHNLQLRKELLPLGEQEVTIRNAMPVVFPEVTRYRLYKTGSNYMSVYPPETSYIEKYSPGYSPNNLYYEVSALYDQVESEKSDKVYVTSVENVFHAPAVQISPVFFTDYVMLQGNEPVSHIDVISISGKICLVIPHPNQLINTSSLAPGLYFFRIIDLHNNQTVIKGVKR